MRWQYEICEEHDGFSVKMTDQSTTNYRNKNTYWLCTDGSCNRRLLGKHRYKTLFKTRNDAWLAIHKSLDAHYRWNLFKL